ncbi:MAG TPA: antibiotic biosynthesis monooxygenase [Candidatus Udaeobacter sp.]|jgi:antibiotic biosynthesis monooxygenase (ABM) superfamily enzyme|nr:antibiotic biosynthesis monooxygenase [Candidatus Udaeobacter sp.]
MNNSSPTNTAILLAKFQLRPDAENLFAEWQARALTHAAGFEGFLNSEITPSAQGLAWNVLLRFADSARLEAWRKSETWHRLLEDAAPLLAEKSSIEVEVKEGEGGSGVVEVIITQVKPGKEAAYRDWETRIQQAQSKFPGYRGSYVQPPVSGELGWTTLMRFDTAEQLDRWLKSPERAALVKEAESLVDYAHLQRMGTSFPGWFPTDPKTGKGPPNWKAGMLVLLGLFPIVMLETRFLKLPVNPSLGMFIGNSISVALTTYLTMPLFIKVLHWWLFPKSDASKIAVNAAGAALIFLLYAISVAALWHLL